MHYPQCNGKGDWSLVLTDKDKNGVACLYGPPPSFTIDKTLLVKEAVCATDQTVAPPPVTARPYEPFQCSSAEVRDLAAQFRRHAYAVLGPPALSPDLHEELLREATVERRASSSG